MYFTKLYAIKNSRFLGFRVPKLKILKEEEVIVMAHTFFFYPRIHLVSFFDLHHVLFVEVTRYVSKDAVKNK